MNSNEAGSAIQGELVELRKQRETLTKQNEVLLTLIENTGELICALDPQGHITVLNSAFKRMIAAVLGLSIGAGARIHKLLDPVLHQRWFEDFDRAMTGEQFSVLRDIQFNGYTLWLSASYHPIVSGDEVTGVTFYAQDVSDLKQAQLSLQESEKQYRSVVDNVKEVVFQTNAEGLWTFLNRSWTEVTGFPVEKSLGRLFLDFVHPDDRERNNLLFGPLLARQKDYCRHMVRYLTLDGGYRYIEVYARLTMDEQDQIVGTSGTLTDVTDRKLMEESLLAMKEEAERASRAKSQFMSRMSHELRTPMNAILGFAQLLQWHNDPPMSADQLDKVEEILQAGNHLLNLIDDVMDLSRIEIGKLHLELVPVRLEDVVKECASLIQPAAAKLQVRLLPLLYLSGMQVVADPVRLRQVLLNLMSNAVKYNLPGGSVEVICEADGDRVRMKVRDTGVGIADCHLPDLFEPYTRFHRSSGVEGTGVGLTISKQLTELMGGTLHAESKEGSGSTFIVTLPRYREEGDDA